MPGQNNKSDCLSKNLSSSFALVSILRNTFLKIQLKKTSLALVVESFTEHNSYLLAFVQLT